MLKRAFLLLLVSSLIAGGVSSAVWSDEPEQKSTDSQSRTSSAPVPASTSRPADSEETDKIKFTLPYLQGKRFILKRDLSTVMKVLDAKTDDVLGETQIRLEQTISITVSKPDKSGQIILTAITQRAKLHAGSKDEKRILDTDKPENLKKFVEGEWLGKFREIEFKLAIDKNGKVTRIAGARKTLTEDVEHDVEKNESSPAHDEHLDKVIAILDGWIEQCLLEPLVYLPAEPKSIGQKWSIERTSKLSPVGGDAPWLTKENSQCTFTGVDKAKPGNFAIVKISGDCKVTEDTEGVEYKISRAGKMKFCVDKSPSGLIAAGEIVTDYIGTVPVKDTPGKIIGQTVEIISLVQDKSDPKTNPVTVKPPAEKFSFAQVYQGGKDSLLISRLDYTLRGRNIKTNEQIYEMGCEIRTDIFISASPVDNVDEIGKTGKIKIDAQMKRARTLCSIKLGRQPMEFVMDSAGKSTPKDDELKQFINAAKAKFSAELNEKTNEISNVSGAEKLAGIFIIPGVSPSDPEKDEVDSNSKILSQWAGQVILRPTVYLPPKPVAVGGQWTVEQTTMFSTFAGDLGWGGLSQAVVAELVEVNKTPAGRIAVIDIVGTAKTVSLGGKEITDGLKVTGKIKYNIDKKSFISAVTEVVGKDISMGDAEEAGEDGGEEAQSDVKHTIRIYGETVIRKPRKSPSASTKPS